MYMSKYYGYGIYIWNMYMYKYIVIYCGHKNTQRTIMGMILERDPLLLLFMYLVKQEHLLFGLNTLFSLTRKAVKGTTIDLLITSDFFMFTQKPKFQK